MNPFHRVKKQVLLFLFLFHLIIGGNALAQSENSIPHIENQGAKSISFCSDSVQVMPDISITNLLIDDDSEGMKVSITNYKRGEDILVWKEISNFKYEWREEYGYLLIQGIGSSEEYENAVKNVYYKNLSEAPSLDNRSFSVSLIDADYLPATQHFYRYIKKRGILWTEARNAAAAINYYGLQGYLATITSKSENDFIWSKIDGVGWIGASDSGQEGEWKWMTGPEAGTKFWQGNYNGNALNGQYSYWNSGEPNNTQKSWGVDEDYAHINSNPNTIPKSWNDLPNEGDKNNPNGYYYPEGFIVEFGGMPGDPEVSLSANAQLKMTKIAFSDIRDYEICEGESQQLNLEASDKYSYSWTPADAINSTASNPVVSPVETTTYNVTGKLDECETSAQFAVKVNPLPVHNWETNYIICEGEELVLDPGNHRSYKWQNLDTSRTILVTEEGEYSVIIANEFGCKNRESTLVKLSTKPSLTNSEIDVLNCGTKKTALTFNFEDDVSASLTAFQQNVIIDGDSTYNPEIEVDEFGKYSFRLSLTDVHQCNYLDTLNIEFHNQPSADFYIDSAKCKGYNIEVSYQGNTAEPAFFEWFSNDTVFTSGTELTEAEIPLGIGQRKRTVGLKINEQGCMDSSIQQVLVAPKLNFWIAGNQEGCSPLNVIFGNNDIEEISSYNWKFGDGNISDLQEPENVYINNDAEIRLYDVELTVLSDEGCKNTGILDDAVKVHPIPTVAFNFEESSCYSAEKEILYTGTGNENDSYNWDLNQFLDEEILSNPGNSMGPLKINRFSEPTVKIGLQVESEFGCKSDTVYKTLKRRPLYKVHFDDTVGCPPLETQFSVNDLENFDQTTYSWSFGTNEKFLGNTVTSVFDKADNNYDVQLTAESQITGCKDTSFFHEKVKVYPVPLSGFKANPSEVYIDNSEIFFENESAGAQLYEWDFGDGSFLSEAQNPIHEFEELGTFDVQLTVQNNFGCNDSVIHQVAVAFERIYPPNAFSPNSSLQEDQEFRIYADGIADEGYQLLIFNRWGEIIFESNSQETGWDGKMKNRVFAPAGVYSWVVQFTDFLGKVHKQQGTVTLLF